MTIPDAGPGGGRATEPGADEQRVIVLLRDARLEARGPGPIIAAPGPPAGDPTLRAFDMED